MEKQEHIITYVNEKISYLNSLGISVSQEQINELLNNRIDMSKDEFEIINTIDVLVERVIENFNKKQEEKQKFIEKLSEVKELQELPLQYTGITLNNQDIDLMLIAGANNPQELQEALSKITNIRLTLNTTELTEEQFVEIRQQVYNMYLDTLTSRNDYIKNRKIELGRKIEYLKSSGILSSEEIATLDNIIYSSRSNDEIVEKLNQSFSSDKVHRMYEIIRDFTPIEKTGIKSSTLEASRNLLEEVRNNYNSITIDEEAKYGKVALQDGSFNFKHLQKALDFAKAHNKQMRLNTLLFYMDCPDELYNLEKTPENQMLLKQKLQSYVEATTRFVVDNGYSDTVRSVDVFNELLNRFAMNGETPYMYRGDIPQTPTTMPNGEILVDDNIKSGWLKHLDIADLCDVIAVARKNMPTTDFMYNDDHLIDPKKIAPTIELIKQIRENEKRLGVKLIDSIGTQMHIDNNLSKSDIEKMVRGLAEFGLPIEITEFDIAMTRDVEGLSDIQIETLRQQKINEVYSVIEQLKDECNIRGFTIWSKTDKQNFRVSLENEERIKNGQEPIITLHGGAFTEDMKPKSKVYEKALLKNDFQSFNYHTHTNRCGHAGISDESEYVATAKANGITQLGFSDHVPVPELEYQDDSQRMHISEVDEYIASIRSLQQQNPDMKINVGFEAEFDPMKEQFLGEIREKVDYLILGQHYVSNGLSREQQKDNPYYPLQYANMVCKAMESGLFDIVAHPDIFMQFRDSLDSEEAKHLFDTNAQLASQAICDKAKELGIPVELNFAGIDKNQVMSDGEYSYPHPMFWKIASETGVQVLYGVDAHTPKQFETIMGNKKVADKIIDPKTLNIVAPNYNPVEARKNNPKLQELYAKGQEKALTYETHLVTQLVGGMLSRFPEEASMGDIAYGTEQLFEQTSISMQQEATKKDQDTVSKIESISSNDSLSKEEKSFQLERTKQTIQHTNETLAHRQGALDRARQSVQYSIEMGCKTKTEVVTTVSQITEANTTKKESTKGKMQECVGRTMQMNQGQQLQHDKPKTLVKQNNNSNNAGFTNVISLALMATFVCGFIAGVGYMVYKIMIGG